MLLHRIHAITSYFTASCLLRRSFILGSLMLFHSLLTTAQTSYVWRGSTSNSWSAAANWEPSRSAPATTDILVFDGAVTPTATVELDYTTMQTIGQIRFSNAVRATLGTNLDRELFINGIAGAVGMSIEAGSVLLLVGTHTTGNQGLTIRFAANVPARIAGRLELRGSASANSAHHILPTTLGAIEFLSGSYLLAGTRFTDHLFGSAKATTNFVIFRNGSTYEQAGGGTPFGNNTTFQITVFEPLSLFRYTATSSTVGLSGRTYGKLEIHTNRSMPATTYGNNPAIIQSDLIITSGQVVLNTANIEIKGDILINGGSLTLPTDANTTTPVVLTFNSTSAQRIGGTVAGTLTLPFNTTLVLDNPAGLTLERPVVANGSVTLNQGLLTTTSTSPLTLGATTTITGSAGSFVQGPLVRQSGAAGTLFFPIGKGKAYRPLTLNITSAPAGTTSYTAEQREGHPADRTLLDDLRQVSYLRSYSLTPSPVPATGTFAGTVTLSFGADDGVVDPSKTSLVVAKSSGAGWSNTGRTDFSAASLTSNTFTTFSDFALASTSPAENPLPISLVSFSGICQPGGVQLRWATASEKQNAYFELERRLENQGFSVLTRVTGRGTTTSATTYSFLDSSPQAGTAYYRLRQVDTDGSVTYSSVIVVSTPNQPVQFTVYPNPATHQLTLAGAGEGGQYRVFNEQGAVQLAGPVSANTSLNVGTLPPGLYRLEVLQGHHRTSRTFIRSRD